MPIPDTEPNPLRATLAELRQQVDAAPHDWERCVISGHILPRGKNCNCWKLSALSRIDAAIALIDAQRAQHPDKVRKER